MKTWLVKDARARFGDVLASARAGEPQRITNRGRGAVVVVAEAEWDRRGGVGEGQAVPLSPGRLFAECPLTSAEWDAVAPKRAPHRSRLAFED